MVLARRVGVEKKPIFSSLLTSLLCHYELIGDMRGVTYLSGRALTFLLSKVQLLIKWVTWDCAPSSRKCQCQCQCHPYTVCCLLFPDSFWGGRSSPSIASIVSKTWISVWRFCQNTRVDYYFIFYWIVLSLILFYDLTIKCDLEVFHFIPGGAADSSIRLHKFLCHCKLTI